MRTHTRSLRTVHDADGPRGQAMAEMAIILPILLVLVFGIIEMALAWRTSQIVTNVTREGARLGVLPGEDNGTVTTRIQTLLDASGLPDEAATITLGCDDDVPGNICDGTGGVVYVQTDYPYQFRLLGPLVELAGGDGGPFGEITISSESMMRKE